MYIRVMSKTRKLFGTALVASSFLASGCGGERNTEPRVDPVIEAAKHPTPPAAEAAYDEEAGKRNLGLGRIVCSHLQAEYVGDRKLRVTAVVKPMPEGMTVQTSLQSTEGIFDVTIGGDGLTIEGDTVSATVDAPAQGRFPRAFVRIAFPTANGHQGVAPCPKDGV